MGNKKHRQHIKQAEGFHQKVNHYCEKRSLIEEGFGDDFIVADVVDGMVLILWHHQHCENCEPEMVRTVLTAEDFADADKGFPKLRKQLAERMELGQAHFAAIRSNMSAAAERHRLAHINLMPNVPEA